MPSEIKSQHLNGLRYSRSIHPTNRQVQMTYAKVFLKDDGESLVWELGIALKEIPKTG